MGLVLQVCIKYVPDLVDAAARAVINVSEACSMCVRSAFHALKAQHRTLSCVQGF